MEADQVLPVNIEDIHDAAKRIGPYVHRTPVLTNATIDQLISVPHEKRCAFFKSEHLQKIGG